MPSDLTTMKISFLLFATFLAVSWARPQFQNNNNQQAYITRYDNDYYGPGQYSYNVETSDGFHHDQTGELRNVQGVPDPVLAVKGSYSYVGPDGVTYTVVYTADENGFQPEGDHIPPSAGVKKLGISSATLASLAG